MIHIKKGWIFGILVLSVVLLLTSCSPEWSNYLEMVKDFLSEADEQSSGSLLAAQKNSKEDTEEKQNNGQSEIESWKYVDFSEIDWSNILPYDGENSILGQPGYAYSVLSQEEQQAYEEIYYAAVTFTDHYELTSTDLDLVKKVFSYVAADHPELFWVKGYQVTHTSRAGKITKINFSISKDREQDAAQELQPEIAKYVQNCLKGIKKDWNVYQKIQYVYEYIIQHTVYDIDSEDNQNICSVFLHGASVCQGYSVATQYLLQALGIPSMTVTGEVLNRGSHAWNLVKIEEQYYYLDTTWGSPSFSEDFKDVDDIVLYDYFCISDKDLEESHKADGIIPLPECSSDEYNYFNQEDYFFKGWDSEQFQSVLEKTIDNGKNYMSIRFATEEMKNEAIQKLIDNYEFFDYLRKVTQEAEVSAGNPITYFENEQLHIITFIWS